MTASKGLGAMTTGGADNGHHRRYVPPVRLEGPRDWGIGALAALVALLVAFTVLRVWQSSPGVPWFYMGDNKSFLLMFQNIQTTGWWTTSRVLGEGASDISSYPLGSGALAHVIPIRLLGLVVRDPITLYNTYFLLSFPLVALAAYYAFRRLTLRPGIAFAISALYAVLPYHFNRGSRGHILLAAYVAVPLAAMFVVRHAAGESVLVKGTASSAESRDRPAHLVEGLGIALLVGASSIYYGLMFVLLLGAVSLVVSIRSRSDVVFTSAFRTGAVSVVALAAGLIPTIVSWFSSRGVPTSVARGYADTEVFSFRIVSAIVPVEGHRIPLLARVRDRIADSPVPGEGPEYLGIIGVLGAAYLLWFVLARLLRSPGKEPDHHLTGPLALCLLVAVLMATVGGLGAVIAAFGLTLLRSWARMGVFISFFAMAGFGIWLQTRTMRNAWSAHRVAVAAGMMLVVGVLDQTAPGMAPDHAALAAEFQEDRSYTNSLEGRLGATATIFQVPFMSFPENREPTRIPPYDHLRWALTGSSLRWSFGGPRDGSIDWQRNVTHLHAPEMALALTALGYDGVMIDRAGFEGGADDLTNGLAERLGPPLNSPDGRYATFSLQDESPVAQSEEIREIVTNSTVARPFGGFAFTDWTVHQPFEAGSSATIRGRLGADVTDEDAHLRLRVRSTEGEVRLQIVGPVDTSDVVLRADRPTVVEVDLPPQPGARFELAFEAEAVDSFGLPPRWELLDIDFPMERRLEDMTE